MNKPKTRPFTTLYMLMSLDGKISSGDSDLLDFDQDLPKIPGAKEGLHQYYEIEKTTDIFSFNTGRVMAKIGVNERKNTPKKVNCTFVILDNKPHLTKQEITYLTNWTRKLILVTNNQNHPAFEMQIPNLEVLQYPDKIDFQKLFSDIHTKFGAKRITIQSGGEMNAVLLREGLIDMVSIVVAPVLVGGRNTSTLIDGESLHDLSELENIKPLKLIEISKLNNSYLHLKYRVKTQ